MSLPMSQLVTVLPVPVGSPSWCPLLIAFVLLQVEVLSRIALLPRSLLRRRSNVLSARFVLLLAQGLLVCWALPSICGSQTQLQFPRLLPLCREGRDLPFCSECSVHRQMSQQPRPLQQLRPLSCGLLTLPSVLVRPHVVLLKGTCTRQSLLLVDGPACA